MKGDFTRFTHRPEKHYTRVLKQQGRVDLDADWNEAFENIIGVERTEANDVIGGCGVPEHGGGFKVDLAVGGNGLQISRGRIYVDGILCSNEAEGETTPIPITDQQDLPVGPGDSILPNQDGVYLAYLDVWERHITYLEDPKIREVALGGPDTTTRTRTICQVKLQALGVNASLDTLGCRLFESLPATGRLTAAKAEKTGQPSNPCVVPADAGYRGLENRLYRVEIHDDGRDVDGNQVRTPTFTWSRDNGSVVLPIATDGIDGDVVTLKRLGQDEVLTVKVGHWVEILGDTTELWGRPGTLAQIGPDGIDKANLEITLSDDVSVHLGEGHLKLRRWDYHATDDVALQNGALPIQGGWFELEDGVQVRFDMAGTYHVGDYWVIPARTRKGTVLWPREGGVPAELGRFGIEHHYCTLSLVRRQGGLWTEVHDCRKVFSPLTGPLLFYVSGDGQDATAPVALNAAARIPLGKPLKVGVSRGSTPVQGARVRFSVTAGGGDLIGTNPATTDGHGVAVINWLLDGQTLSQQVTAELIDVDNQRIHLPIVFTAELRRLGNAAGCATYVVDPTGDWVGFLKNLRPGEDAHICFQRGRFETRGEVVFRGLGHVSMSGVGDGTEVVVGRSDKAFHFFHCKSVRVNGLSVAAPDGSKVIGHVGHRNGVLTMTGCPMVDIRDTNVRCGAGTKLERTCITVRADAGRPLDSVRILGNRLTVGYNQIGILATDCRRVVIQDNELVVSRRPASLPFDILLRDPKRRAKLVKLLVKAAVLEEKLPSTKKAKELKAGRYTARFRSAIPESEWRGLMKKQPPKAVDKKSGAAFERYVNKLIGSVVDDPSLLPSYDRHIRDLEPANLSREVKAGLVVSGKVEVRTFNQLTEEKRGVAIVVDDNRVQFDSPVSEKDWAKILRANLVTVAHSNAEVLNNVRASALRLITDRAFRNRFATAKVWFDRLRTSNPSVGHQGIVCAGKTLTEVRIQHNSMTGFFEGIHVGVSRRAAAKDRALRIGSVTVDGNRVQLRVPMEEDRGEDGIFVGNARRIAIENNELTSRLQRAEKPYRDGIRIWGHLGPFVVLRQNFTEGCRNGIRVVALDQLRNPLWRAVDNLVVRGSSIVLPSGFIRRDNRILP